MASNDLLAVILVTDLRELNAATARVLASKGQGDINVVVDVEKEVKRAPLVSEDHHFSAPALQTFDNGPMQYKFSYVLRVPTAGKTYCNLGGAVHEVIENLTRQELEGIPPTEEQALAMLEQFWSSDAYASKKKEREDTERAEQMIDTDFAWQSQKKSRFRC